MGKRMEKQKSFSVADFARRQALIIVLIGIVVVFSFLSKQFLTTDNIVNIFRQISTIAVMGAGMTFCIVGGNFDLSVGALLSMCGCMFIFMYDRVGTIPALLITLAIGCASGVVCGFLCGYLRLNSMIVTLGMQQVLQALTLMFTGGQYVQLKDLNAPITVIGKGNIGIVPVSVIIMALFCVLYATILSKTVFGHRVKAVGSNAETSRYSGINDKKVVLLTFVLSGVSAAVGGIILSTRGGGGQSTMGMGYEFDVITAVILGGASLAGGSGSIFRTFIGALIIGILKTGFVLLGLSSYTQYVAECIIILFAVYLDISASKRKVR